jgi:hypothetical protein
VLQNWKKLQYLTKDIAETKFEKLWLSNFIFTTCLHNNAEVFLNFVMDVSLINFIYFNLIYNKGKLIKMKRSPDESNK